MRKHEIRLPGGAVLTSGSGSTDAVRSVTLTEQVNDQTDLYPGAACAACAVIELWAPENALQIAQGDELTLSCTDTGTGARETLGIFRAEKPEKASANVYRVTAYDRMTLLDKDLSPWLRAQQGAFPLALTALVEQVCAQCGVTLADGALDDLPGGDYQVPPFYADGLTGRQLIQWAAQIACRFARMDPRGRLTFGWYGALSAAGHIGPAAGQVRTGLRLAGAVLRTASGQVWRFGSTQAAYRQGQLRYEDCTTAPLDKVQIRQSDSDVGVIYPPDAAGTNALVLQGNLLLTAASAETLQPVARRLYETLGAVRYTPLTVSLTADGGLLPPAGSRVTVQDAYGRLMEVYVMQRTLAGQTLTLTATGNPRRDSVAAVNEQKYTNLQGKLLEIRTGIEGLNIRASDLAGGLASLELTVDGLRTEVSGKLDGDDAQTLIDQNLRGLTLSAQAGAQSSTLTLTAGGVTLTSAQIRFDGMVTFEDLATAGKTAINGSNITTGRIGSAAGNTLYDLDAGTLRTGKSGSTRVEINDSGIRWYYQNYLTGVLHSEYGATYIGDNSHHTFLGWFSSAAPSFGWSDGGATGQFVGIAIDQVDKIIHCNASKFEIPGRIECASLGVNGREI